MQGDVFDIEADGLAPTKVHCLSVNTKHIRSTDDYNNMRSYFTKAKILVGHNITRYDIPAIERLLGIKVTAKLVDTLALSWYLYPNRLRHGLAEWGEEFGIPKPVVEDWEDQPVEVYIHRCEEDVKINTKLWEKMWKHLMRLYGSEEEAWRLIDYLSFKMDCAAMQEKHKWKLDVERCTRVLGELTPLKEAKVTELAEAMPPVIKMGEKSRPNKMYLKGKVKALTVVGQQWLDLLAEKGLPEDYDGVVEYEKSREEPNPGSHDQIKNWLYSLGWEPLTFKYKRDKITGDVRKIPQVQQDKAKGPGLCRSVKELYVKEPKLEVLDGLSILTHRIAVLSGFLDNVDGEGYVRAEVQGLTNTLRFKHRVVVNLPGVDKLYGSDIRGCLVAVEGSELCGSDMSSLEDRTKQHYMWEYDPEYVKSMIVDGFDPHLDLAEFAGELTPLQVAMHKAKEEDHGAVRKIYKAVNYACVYGAGAPTVARAAGCTLQKAEKLVAAYWKRNWSVKKIAEDQEIKTCMGKKWLFNPVSRFWYSLRFEKDRFSTLNQGTGVYCFDVWMGYVNNGGPPEIGQFHDEGIWLVKIGLRDRMTSHIRSAMDKTNAELQLNRELDCSVDFGSTYADIH
jgi:hypothetical protein